MSNLRKIEKMIKNRKNQKNRGADIKELLELLSEELEGVLTIQQIDSIPFNIKTEEHFQYYGWETVKRTAKLRLTSDGVKAIYFPYTPIDEDLFNTEHDIESNQKEVDFTEDLFEYPNIVNSVYSLFRILERFLGVNQEKEAKVEIEKLIEKFKN